MNKPNAYGTGIACLLVTAVGWGLNWPAMKQLMLELPPLFARGVAGLGEPLGVREVATLVMTVGGVGLVIFKGDR
ncbi:hypothetical protein [Pigmentiphaga aceris]|uniref:hypothetical protein n=1 Tax=Pigmentiphaga aceris TaxID=1940612 RepID=UPI001CA307E4|nr:hypothetical protein [Pigmentiphaga aceris]